jgi:hypothetical protein
MSNKVKISDDGSFIDFNKSESIPTTAKKFRQSPEIQGFYSFVYDNGLQREAFEILTQILIQRRAAKIAMGLQAGAPDAKAAKGRKGKEEVVVAAVVPAKSKVAQPAAAKKMAEKKAKPVMKPVAAKAKKSGPAPKKAGKK